MGKYERFSALDPGPGRGYTAGPSLHEAARLDGLMGDFKAWFTSVRGFRPELLRFFADHATEFSEDTEEHSHAYFLLYSEFLARVEKTTQTWLQAKGLHEDDFALMLAQGQRYGESENDAVTGVLLGLLDYPLWIENIFALRREVLPEPDADGEGAEAAFHADVAEEPDLRKAEVCADVAGDLEAANSALQIASDGDAELEAWIRDPGIEGSPLRGAPAELGPLSSPAPATERPVFAPPKRTPSKERVTVPDCGPIAPSFHALDAASWCD